MSKSVIQILPNQVRINIHSNFQMMPALHSPVQKREVVTMPLCVLLRYVLGRG